MIDLQNEQVLSLKNAAKLLPARRRGKRPHSTTLARWAKYGFRGTRLEVICIGDVTCTSVVNSAERISAIPTHDYPPSGLKKLRVIASTHPTYRGYWDS